MTDLPDSILESKNYFDLTNDNHYRIVRDLADILLQNSLSEKELNEIATGNLPLMSKLAGYLALSRRAILKHRDKELNIAIVINLIHEHHRLLPCTALNPNGENSLKNKLEQLEWITRGMNINYKLLYFAGKCPWKSDKILKKLVRELKAEKIVKLYRLGDYEIASDFIMDQKGGEMIFGLRTAAGLPGYPKVNDVKEFDGVLFTDADMTFDMAQIGFLIDGLMNGKNIQIGERTHPKSVLVKNIIRAGRGIFVYRHIQRRLGPVYFEKLKLLDTQCPWKFFSTKSLKEIAPMLNSMDWSIDTDIIGGYIYKGYPINIIPVTAIDSELESHGRAIGHHVRMFTILYGLIRQAEKYNLPYDKKVAGLLYKYIETPEDLRKLLDAGPPPGKENLPNSAWGKIETFPYHELEDWLSKATGK